MAKQVLNNLETMGTIRSKINSNFTETYGQGSTEFITAGVTGSTLPAITNNGDGTINIASCNASLYDNADYSGIISNYTISSINNLSLIDKTVNYVYIDYNAGTPVFNTTIDKNDINSSNKIPIFTIYRDGANIHSLNFGTMGTGAMNKVLETLSRLNRFTRCSGLTISTSSLWVSLTAGIVYKAYIEPISLDAISTSIDNLFQMSYNGSDWNKTTGAFYNNTQFQGASGLETLANQKWTVNWIYRGIGAEKHLYLVLGDEYENEDDANDSSEPSNLPLIITSHCMLVGRIIVKKGSIATEHNTQSVFKETFSTAPISIHNNLSDLQKAGAGIEWGHVDAGIQKFYGKKTFDDEVATKGHFFVNGNGAILKAGETDWVNSKIINSEYNAGLNEDVIDVYVPGDTANNTIRRLRLTRNGNNILTGNLSIDGDLTVGDDEAFAGAYHNIFKNTDDSKSLLMLSSRQYGQTHDIKIDQIPVGRDSGYVQGVRTKVWSNSASPTINDIHYSLVTIDRTGAEIAELATWNEHGNLDLIGNLQVGGNVGIGTTTPEGVLDTTPDSITATSYSFGTRVTNTQMEALTGMTDGAEVYNLDTHSKHIYNGSYWQNTTHLDRITLFAKAGLFDFSAINLLSRKWYFNDGTTSTAEQPAKTLASAGRVILEGDFANSVGVILNDNDTNSLYRGALKDFKYINGYLRLYGCTSITGDLKDLPNLTALNLNGCALITGDLADLPNLTTYLSLTDCALITGDLTDLPNLTTYLSLLHCVNTTGAYVNVVGENVPLETFLSNTGMSATDMDDTLIAYEACTKDNGTFIATGMTRTTASDTAVTNLEARGWTITGITVV